MPTIHEVVDRLSASAKTPSDDTPDETIDLEKNLYIPDYASPDHELENLVRLINIEPEGKLFPVTLFVKGLIVTGNIISSGTYFERLADVFTDPETSDYHRQKAAEVRQEWLDGPDDPIRYINLEMSAIYGGGAVINTPWLLWRGRLASVDGWVHGQFEAES